MTELASLEEDEHGTIVIGAMDDFLKQTKSNSEKKKTKKKLIEKTYQDNKGYLGRVRLT